MKKVLITGANGLLGQALVQCFHPDYKVLASGVESRFFLNNIAVGYVKLDVTELDACREIFQSFKPDIVVNAAAYTFVDDCEKNKDLCWAINVKAPENLAHCSREQGSHLLHYSTDYVFSGEEGPYSEDAKCHPLGHYGASKLASEKILAEIGGKITIFRTCVLYGSGVDVKRNFFLWIWENLKSGRKISVVTDQFNNPTLAEDLARGTRLAAENGVTGLFHLAGPDYLSRYEFAVSLAKVFGFSVELIQAVKTKDLGQLAMRPPRGGLKIDRAREVLKFKPKSIQDAFTYLRRKIENNG